MILNEAGKAAHQYWIEIPQHFPNAILREHIVMPNHVHGIIEISDAGGSVGSEKFFRPYICVITKKPNLNRRKKPIGSIVRGYKNWDNKMVSEILCRKNMILTGGFGSVITMIHIIRDEAAYKRSHITLPNNPANFGWEDKFLFRKPQG